MVKDNNKIYNDKNIRDCMFPFNSKNSQKAFGFLLSIYGLIIVMIGLNSSIFLNAYLFNISFTLLGILVTMVGIFYFADSIFSG